MALTTKEPFELDSLTKADARPDDPQSKSAQNPRSNPVCLEVPVTVRSLPGEKEGDSSGVAQPIREESRTVIVFDNGAVLRLSSDLPAGQGLIVSNARGRDVVCRVVHARKLPTVKGYIEIEFVEPVNDFWAIHEPADRVSALAPSAPVAPPAQVIPIVPLTPLPVAPRVAATANETDQVAGSAPTFDDIAGLVQMSSQHSPSRQPLEIASRTASLIHDKEFAPDLTEPTKPATITSAVSRDTKAKPFFAPGREMAGQFRAGQSQEVSLSASESHNFMSRGLLDPGRGLAMSASSGSRGKMPLIIASAVLLLMGIGAGAFFIFHEGGSSPGNSMTPVQPAASLPPAPTATKSPEVPQSAAAQLTPVQPVSSVSSEPSLIEAVSVPVEPRTESRVASRTVANQPDHAALPRQAAPNLKLSVPTVAKRNSAIVGEASAPSIPDVASIAADTPVGGILPSPSRIPTAPVPLLSGTLVDPKLISTVRPDYPPMAKNAKIEGVVVVVAEIDANGRVGQATATSGPGILQEAAIAAVKRWRYEPARMNGRPVPARVTVSVNFRAQ